MTITIRPARQADAKLIKALIQQVRINPFGLDWRRFLVAEEQGTDGAGRFVGCVQIKPHADGTRELASLAVTPEKHGQGIGTSLIKVLLAQETGIIYLMCADNMAAYYQHFGFTIVEADAVPRSLHRYVLISRLIPRWLTKHSLVIMRYR